MKLMPPQNPAPVTPTPAPDRYDFFLTPPPSKNKLKLPTLGSQSLGKRLLVVGGGLVVLIILIVVVSSLFSGGVISPDFIAVAQDQNELARVAAEASSQQTADQTTLNLAQDIQLSLTSAQQQLLTYLQANGLKISSVQLNATKNIKTDQELTAAEAASNFDPVFDQVVQTALQNYIQAIKITYTSAGPKGKALLQIEYNGASLLLKQTTATISSLPSQ